MVNGMKKRLETIASEIDAAKSRLEQALDEAQTEFDDRSERWQESGAGAEEQERLDNLQAAIDDIDGAVAVLREMTA